jgi:Zn-dependent protease with chaperone function
MTPVALLAPVFVAAVLALFTAGAHRRLPPHIAARVTTASLVAVAAAALPSVWLLGLSYLAHLPIIGGSFQWCAMAMGIHHDVPAVIGIPSVLVGAIGAPRAVQVIRRDRKLRMHDAGPIEYIDSPEPYAVTVPGRGGRVVISTGLLDLVDDAELDAVIAHEETHAEHRHDRYLLIARTVAALIPFVRPITVRLQYSLERWADEQAARTCRDRRVVASALAKVALGQPAQPALLGFGNLGVTGRVEALMVAAPPAMPTRRIAAVLWASIAATALLGVVQLHHLGTLIAALCPT